MNLADIYAPARGASVPGSDEDLLLALFRRVLTYSHKPSGISLDDLPRRRDYTLADLIEATMAGAFWTDMWVQRPEYEWLLKNLVFQRAIVLHGMRGVGKSTVFYRLLHDSTGQEAERGLAMPPFDRDFFLFDVEPILINDEDDMQETLRDLYADLLRRLKDTYLERSEKVLILAQEISVARAWLYFQILRSTDFRGLLDHLRVLEVDRRDPNAVVEAALSDTCARMYGEARSRYDAQSPRDEFDDVVTFLTHPDYLSRRICLMIDNVDSKAPATQDIVFSEYERIHNDFDENVSVILNARDNTLTRYREEHGGNLLGATHAVGVDGRLLADVVHQRIRALDRITRAAKAVSKAGKSGDTATWLYPDSVLKTMIEYLASLEDFKASTNGDYFETLTMTIERACSQLTAEHENSRSFADLLIRWQNNSIRSTAYQLSAIVDHIALGKDPSGLHRSRMRVGDVDNRAELFSLLYRHMIFGAESIYETPPLLDLVHPAPRNGAAPLLLPLHLLEFLRNAAQVTEVQWSDVLELGEHYGGLLPETLYSALEDLNCNRGYEAEGFVRIHSGRQRGGAMPTTVRLEVRPSGDLFLHHVSTSVEYLCWAGLTDPSTRAHPLLEHLHSLEQLRDPTLRLRAACAFTDAVLIPTYEIEAHRFHTLVAPTSETSRRFRRLIGEWRGGFGPFETGGLHIAERALETIDRKVAEVDDAPNKDDMAPLVLKMHTRVRNIREDVVGTGNTSGSRP